MDSKMIINLWLNENLYGHISLGNRELNSGAALFYHRPSQSFYPPAGHSASSWEWSYGCQKKLISRGDPTSSFLGALFPRAPQNIFVNHVDLKFNNYEMNPVI